MAKLSKVFRYCPRCAGGLVWEKQRKAICATCGKELYNQPKVTGTAILLDPRGNILLHRRARDPYRNKWGTPGGWVEIGESGEEAIRREIYEELGLWLKNLKYFCSFSSVYPYQGIDLQYLELVFIASLPKGKMSADKDEIAELKFFAPNKIPYRQLAFQSHNEALRLYARLARESSQQQKTRR